MAGKRKRSRPERSTYTQNKRCKLPETELSNERFVRDSLLSQYYTKVLTLREYLLSRLPSSSKIRKKKILCLKRRPQPAAETLNEQDGDTLGQFLASTLVGVLQENFMRKDDRWAHWTSYSQLAEVSETTGRSSIGEAGCSQSEIVDFTIWQLFRGNKPCSRLQHMLCQGYRKDVNFHSINRHENMISAIPGIISTHPNHHVTAMKSRPWPQILALMGAESYKVMVDLILDCGIFVAVKSGHGNYFQLSGQPLGDLLILRDRRSGQESPRSHIFPNAVESQQSSLSDPVHSPSSIMFIRNRMLHARATLNAKGAIRFGLRHIHVLNRYPYRSIDPALRCEKCAGSDGDDSTDTRNKKNHRSTIHVMMYIFPREFGLHNVFTSNVDSRETVQPLQDYTLREDEISCKFQGKKTNKDIVGIGSIPKRLRGKISELVQKLRINHTRCPYNELLKHYCSSLGGCINTSVMETGGSGCDASVAFNTQAAIQLPETDTIFTSRTASAPVVQPRLISLMKHATPVANVSAFCRAALSMLIPNEVWGEGNTQIHNKCMFLRNVDRFISLRRFETLSLHEAVQGMKINDIPWLAPRNDVTSKSSQSDTQKRLQLFHEFVYYIFDSILIPLIRGQFYVTESSSHRYRLFFFRHDIWRSLSEPALTALRVEMFREMNLEEAQRILNARAIGFSQLRLLPKETGIRPVMNLKRRVLKKGYKHMLGSSINSILAPVFNVLTYEKGVNPNRLGSTISSVGNLYNKLAKFASRVTKSSAPLFFVKVDVQSAFDTIPQSAVLKLMASIPRESEYRISKHAEIKPGEGHRLEVAGQSKTKPIRKWVSLATSSGDFQSFDDNLETNLAVGKKNTVFVENIVSQFRKREDLLELLAEHVQNNIVKVGKKFYCQRKGIPQGSVLSSLLCNYFYADLEARHLSFLDHSESLLLRLVDDFLIITTNRQHARMFLQVMHDGLPDYGVTVNPTKTLVNFEVCINGLKIKRLVGTRNFPYCGNFIDTKTLNVSKDRDRRKDSSMADALTVEYSKMPGKAFHRKVMNAFKIQAHTMFFDTSFNSLNTVFSNIYDNFIETATKMWQYTKCLPSEKQPGPKLVIRTINDLIELAFLLLKSKGRDGRNPGYKCVVSRIQTEWLAVTAFHGVLQRKQSKYQEVVAWLEGRIEAIRGNKAKDCARMADAVCKSSSRTKEF